ncbi:unnamed protein product [Trichobilharzia szidati]|nr:unnamed protein product [Trichobilharzia szidati]
MEVDLPDTNESITDTNTDNTSECQEAHPETVQTMDTEETVPTDCNDNDDNAKKQDGSECEILSNSDNKKSTESPTPTVNVYHPPVWALNCPPTLNYKLEVIKNGLQLTECTVNLSSTTSTTMDSESSCDDNSLSYCLIGRQPQPYYDASFNDLAGQCITLAHPSISRLHAVLQYGKPPHSVGNVPEDEKDTTGWYLKDLDSTHGTFVNKRRLPSGRYVRIRVGYVLRFGGSTRLHIFQGPDEDTEQETIQSWSELKKAYEERKLMALKEKIDTSTNQNSQSVKLECDWGMSLEDPTPEPIPSLLQSGTCLSHEKLYRDDPKRALNAYFEREGIDPAPQYEFVEAPFGKQHCRIELPLSSGTVTAEAVVSGKRKEAVVACALEACQLLDRLGEFDPDKDRSGSSKHVRSRAYWEENDYYSSDEDTFVDRTGIIEKKRLDRMRQLGVSNNNGDEESQSNANKQDDLKMKRNEKRISEDSTMLSILSELEKIGEEIVSIEEELEAIDREFSSKEANPSQLDELEAYMNALKTSSSNRAKRSKLKARLISLRQTELQLMHRAGLTQFRRNLKKSNGQINNSEYISSSEAAAAVRAAKNNTSEQKIKNARADRNALKRSLQNHARSLYVSQKKIEVDKPFEVESDDDEDENDDGDIDKKKKNHEHRDECDKKEEVKNERIITDDSADPVKSNDQSSSSSSSSITNKNNAKMKKYTEPIHHHQTTPLIPTNESVEDKLTTSSDVNITVNNVSVDETLQNIAMETKESDNKKQPTAKVKGPTLPPQESQKPSKQEVNRKTKALLETDPDYVEWVPPADQRGDGITALNAKYGY